ncbi:MAG: zf-HC2 domain-containing protein [Halomonas sp.]|uniref:zf-HC2 domain-containing protein n=1 Tax=Halomonas sp. TaxID=1486246 RepID=UPI002ACDE426|nr:zf-HC2 domain-containing protein [Halomonas sp.]MDZ7851109.1 zf-HC2 domain-containing protein [Halomonas sp.]
MCKEATRLMSLKQDRSLTFQERISLRLHLSMCGACRECNRQFDLLHEAGEKFVPAHDPDRKEGPEKKGDPDKKDDPENDDDGR